MLVAVSGSFFNQRSPPLLEVLWGNGITGLRAGLLRVEFVRKLPSFHLTPPIIHNLLKVSVLSGKPNAPQSPALPLDQAWIDSV